MTSPNTQSTTARTLTSEEQEAFMLMAQAINESVAKAWEPKFKALEEKLATLSAGSTSGIGADLKRVEELLGRAEKLGTKGEPSAEDLLKEAERKNMGFIARQVADVKATTTGSKVILIGAGVAAGVGATVGTMYAVEKYRDYKAGKADAAASSSEFVTGL